MEREIDGEVVERPLADPDPDSNPPAAAVAAETRDEVAKALMRLPPEQREILTLKYVQGLSYEQICEVLSIGMGTVKSKLWRAKQALKNILKNGNIF